MAKDLIIGRQKEIEQINECYESKESQLVILYGRRRVGKTFLINQIFDEQFAFKLVGDYNQNKKEQLYNFYEELKRKSKTEVSVPQSWREAFFPLRDYIDSLPRDKKQVVFFDCLIDYLSLS